LREEITARGNVKAKDGEDAMNAVVAAIREQEASGEIMLVAEDE
jgi:flagellar motor switch protein FliG